MPSVSTELLAPARDLECGIAAIDCGADAVYIGAPRFGAREAAGNSIEDIAALARYAHRFWARVYVTLNTLLRDDEIDGACRTAWELHEAGIDGLIIQDLGLLECELPPVPLIASTQMHNHTPERVAFLEKVGFSRVILARELDLAQIRAIRRAAPEIEMECFVHGALCVCYSGQCLLSYALGGRSGNRGQCAQPCRKPYTLVDAEGLTAAPRAHWLSLRDLNLSDHLAELLEAGVRSFKIEGRLKDRAYVANAVAHYRGRLDAALAAAVLPRSSSGCSRPGLVPDPAKTFNRGFTTYFLHGRTERIGSPETPKMTGEAVGRVVRLEAANFTLDGGPPLHPGDGICFFDGAGELRGTVVNAISGRTVTPERMDGIERGTRIHRNHDHEFLARLQKAVASRKIAVTLALSGGTGGLALAATDADGNRAEAAVPGPFDAAAKPRQALAIMRRQLEKTGGTDFACAGVEIGTDPVPFVPVAALNALRRGALERLAEARERNRPRPGHSLKAVSRNDARYPERTLSYLGNVLNERAAAFYRRHGVVTIEPAAESGLDLRGRTVMTARYCVKHQLGRCPREGARERFAEPLWLVDDEGRRLELHFDCARCEMEVRLPPA